jgi:hypothetical protein
MDDFDLLIDKLEEEIDIMSQQLVAIKYVLCYVLTTHSRTSLRGIKNLERARRREEAMATVDTKSKKPVHSLHRTNA